MDQVQILLTGIGFIEVGPFDYLSALVPNYCAQETTVTTKWFSVQSTRLVYE